MTNAELDAALAEADVWVAGRHIWLTRCRRCGRTVEEGDIHDERADGRPFGNDGACGRCAGYRTD